MHSSHRRKTNQSSSSSVDGGSSCPTRSERSNRHTKLIKLLNSELVFACTTSISSGCSCPAYGSAVKNPGCAASGRFDITFTANAPTICSAASRFVNSPIRFNVTPTRIALLSNVAAVICEVGFRIIRRLSLRFPHVHIIEMAETTTPDVDNTKEPVVCDSTSLCRPMTFRTNNRMTAETTERITWLHQENHDNRRSEMDVSTTSGSAGVVATGAEDAESSLFLDADRCQIRRRGAAAVVVGFRVLPERYVRAASARERRGDRKRGEEMRGAAVPNATGAVVGDRTCRSGRTNALAVGTTARKRTATAAAATATAADLRGARFILTCHSLLRCY